MDWTDRNMHNPAYPYASSHVLGHLGLHIARLIGCIQLSRKKPSTLELSVPFGNTSKGLWMQRFRWARHYNRRTILRHVFRETERHQHTQELSFRQPCHRFRGHGPQKLLE